jgi:hypothetical protein
MFNCISFLSITSKFARQKVKIVAAIVQTNPGFRIVVKLDVLLLVYGSVKNAASFNPKKKECSARRFRNNCLPV